MAAAFGKEKLVVALGGGGSRGLAHLGVLEVLEEEGIPIQGLIGTSVGAIVGAAYALEPDAKALTEKTLRYLVSPRFRNDMFKRMMFGANEVEQNFALSVLTAIRKSFHFTGLIRRNAVFDGTKLRATIEEIIRDATFEETAIPFAVPAIDLRPPQEVLLTTGSLRDAVTASCSLPGFFPPVEIGDMLLADVGVIGSIPVDAAREFIGGALVIAVDLSTRLEPMHSVRRGWDCILRVETIASSKLNQQELARADVVIRPEIGRKYWSDFSDLQRMVDAGKKAAREAMPEIKSRLHHWLRFVRR